MTPRRFVLLSGWLRRLPSIWLIMAVQVALMLGTTVLYPAFQAPDEAGHIDYVLAHRHGEWLDAPGTRAYQSGVLAAMAQIPSGQFALHVGGTPALTRSERQSFDELGTGSSTSFIKDQMTQHPPLYYGLATAWSYLLPNFAHQRFDVQVFWLRLFSIILLLPVPLLIYRTGLRLLANRNAALLAAMVPLSMPIYLRAGGAVNNDTLLILLTTVLAALLAKVALGDLSRRTALLVGAAWGLDLLTKGFALALPPAIVLAYLVGANGSFVSRVRAAFAPTLVAGFSGAAIGGWWWVRNIVVNGKLQPDGYGPLTDPQRQFMFGTDVPGGSEGHFFTTFFRLLGQRMWGSLGQIDRPSLPHPLLQVLSVTALVLLVAACVLGGRIPNWTSGRAAVLLSPAVLILVLMYAGSRSEYVDSGHFSGIQARYVITGILGLALCVAVVADRLARHGRWLLPAVFGAQMAFVAASAYWVLDVQLSDGKFGAVHRLGVGVRFAVGWAPWPAAVTGLLFLCTLGVIALCGLSLWMSAADEPSPVPDEAEPSTLVAG